MINIALKFYLRIHKRKVFKIFSENFRIVNDLIEYNIKNISYVIFTQ